MRLRRTFDVVLEVIRACIPSADASRRLTPTMHDARRRLRRGCPLGCPLPQCTGCTPRTNRALPHSELCYFPASSAPSAFLFGASRASIPRASMAKPSGFLGVLLVSGPWVSLGVSLTPCVVCTGCTVGGIGGGRCGYFCALSGRCALVSGVKWVRVSRADSGVQSRMDNVIMQRGIMRCGSQPKRGWRIRCTQGYLS